VEQEHYSPQIELKLKTWEPSTKLDIFLSFFWRPILGFSKITIKNQPNNCADYEGTPI